MELVNTFYHKRLRKRKAQKHLNAGNKNVKTIDQINRQKQNKNNRSRL